MVMYMKKIFNKDILYRILSLLLVASSATFLGLLFYMNLLPSKYSIILLCVVIFFVGINLICINLKKTKKKTKNIFSVFSILIVIIFVVASFYIWKTIDVLSSNGETKYRVENYSVIVLKDSKYDKIEDIEGEDVGYFQNSIGYDKANKKIKKEVNVNFEGYKTADLLAQELLNSNINVIVLEDSIKNIMDEEITDFSESIKVIYTFTIKTDSESTLKEVNVTKESFAIYISGIDTYGEISSVSRSDVNMVMIANPNTHQILLISIPRDYYVQLHGTTGNKDKLTHAGIYGVDMSIGTLEDLLDVDINYYLKVNFTSVIDIVNALGGLDVYSEYTFTSYSGYRFKKGMNYVNGEQALDFARTRKAFIDGDRQRGKNQQAVIEAIIRKVTDKSIITKYSSLLNAVNGKYQTNMSVKNITSILRTQLEEMSAWNITSYSLTGKDSMRYTYTYNQLLYVMEPDSESVAEAIQLIKNVLNGETLESSYNDVGGTSNKVTQEQVSYPTPPQDPEIKEEDSEESEELEEDTELPEKKEEEEIKKEENPSIEEEPPSDTDEDEKVEENPVEDLIPTPEN